MLMKRYISPEIECETVLPDVLLASDLEIDISGQYEDEGEKPVLPTMCSPFSTRLSVFRWPGLFCAYKY